MTQETQYPDIKLSLAKILKTDNIATLLDESQLNVIAGDVIREFDIDKVSRADKEDKIEKSMDMALQVVDQKNYPWPGASNVKFPLLTQAALNFASRAYPALITSFGVVKPRVIGSDEGQVTLDENGQEINVGAMEKRKRGERTSKMINYQLSEEMEEWEDDTDRLLHVISIAGCMFRKNYFDPTLGRNTSTIIFSKHFVINSDAKSMESCPRYTQVIDDMYANDIESRIRQGIYIEFDYGTATREGELEQDKTTPHTFYEQHRWLDLDGDGYQEPYIVTVHKDKSKTVSIVKRYAEENIKRNKKGDIAHIEQDLYFTKYGFIPNPDGSYYDIGFGDLLMPINESINSSINQMFDAGHLAITGGGFLGKGIRMKGGVMRRRPGEFKMVDVAGGNLRENIVELNHPQASPVMLSLLDALVNAGKEIAGTQDILTENAGNQATFTTMAMVDEGARSFKSIYKRLHRALRSEIKKIIRLNYDYLTPEKYMEVLDEPADPKADFNYEDCDIVPVTDPEAVLDMQKMTKAQLLVDFKDDPLINPLEVRKRILEAGGIEDAESLIMPPAPPGVDPLIEVEQYKAESAKDKGDRDIEIRQAQLDLDRERLEFEREKFYSSQGHEVKLTTYKTETDKEIEYAKMGDVKDARGESIKHKLLEKRIDNMQPDELHSFLPTVPEEQMKSVADAIEKLAQVLAESNMTIAEGLQRNNEAVTEMIGKLTAEKEVVRDENGRPVSVRIKE